MSQQGLIDRWIEKLSSDSQSQGEAVKEFVKQLNKDLREELKLAMELEAEADHLIYEHLAKEIREIVKRKNELAKTIEKLITDLGGGIDKKELENYVAEPDGQFREILKVETELGNRFVEQVNLAEDTGLHKAAEVLIDLKEKSYSHLETIENIVMKINTSL
jgi:transcription initiation factor TFIIIB Brf1 subunit/transcription initiation factor TFIIB